MGSLTYCKAMHTFKHKCFFLEGLLLQCKSQRHSGIIKKKNQMLFYRSCLCPESRITVVEGFPSHLKEHLRTSSLICVLTNEDVIIHQVPLLNHIANRQPPKLLIWGIFPCQVLRILNAPTNWQYLFTIALVNST